MPLRVLPIGGKENELAASRAPHAPLRFTAWVDPEYRRRTSSFETPLCPESALRDIATTTPAVPFLELIVLEHGGRLIGYLGHPKEYQRRSPHGGMPRLRRRVVSDSDSLLNHLERSLVPGTLHRLLRDLSRQQRLIQRAAEILHARSEENARTAHFLFSRLTPHHEFDSITRTRTT